MMVVYTPVFGSTLEVAQCSPNYITGTGLFFAQQAAAFFLVVSNRKQSDFISIRFVGE